MRMQYRSSRRIMAAAAAASLALAIGLTGCQQPADDDDARVAELEQQVEDLQQQLDDQGTGTSNGQGAAADAGGSGSANAGAASNAVVTDGALNADITAAYPELADYEARVAELEETCANVPVSQDRNANYDTFRSVKQQIETLDHEMEAYDDQQEAAARAGTLSADEYRRIERAVDYLDERLGHAEDGMEIALGVDD